jgi:hypothetical protein
MNEILEQEQQQEKRPVFLTVLVILSFVYIGWSMLSHLLSLARGPMTEEQLEEAKVEMTKSINQMKGTDGMEWIEDLMRSSIEMIESTNASHTLYILTGILILVIGIAGVLFMMRGRKLGFHVYIIYSFLASVQIYLFVAPSLLSNAMVIFGLFISGIFVLLYGLNLKWMK